MVTAEPVELAPGFVAVIDGSERALRALSAAARLGEWYGRPISVCAVTGGPDDRDTTSAVQLQLESLKVEPAETLYIANAELEPYLFTRMRHGAVLVASAFGVWAGDGRLHAMLNGLVRHDAPAIIGVGPNVDNAWAPSSTRPIVVCVDDSNHAHHVADQIAAFLVPARNRVIVVHVTAETLTPPNIATEVAFEIQQRFGQPVESRTVHGDNAVVEIVSLALDVQASLVITHSWHRSTAGTSSVSSTSLTSVAHAPCPVVILSDGPGDLPSNYD